MELSSEIFFFLINLGFLIPLYHKTVPRLLFLKLNSGYTPFLGYVLYARILKTLTLI